MNRCHPPALLAVLIVVGGLVAPCTALASEVGYNSCPQYPFDLCPPGSQGAIPDNSPNGITFTMQVNSDGEDFITDVSPWFFIEHTYQGDLRVVLTSPAGTSVELINRPGLPACGAFGFSADNFGFFDNGPPFCFQFVCRFHLSDSAALPYQPPFVGCPGISDVNGDWRPVTPLSAFDGQSKVGTWRLFVQDLGAGDVGTLVLWGMNIRTEPATAPIVDIAIPDDYACGCSGAAITGTAADPDGTFDQYTLDWSVDSAGPWTTIAQSFFPVNDGTLGVFPAGMPEGYSYVRLTATNIIGLSSTFVKVIYQDRTFDAVGILDPEENEIVGGSVCMNKVVASDYCFASAELAYAPQGGGFTTFYSTDAPVQEFPTWDTTALPDGNYLLRVSGATVCGNAGSAETPVIIDNTAPVAVIHSPANCAALGGTVPITGTVTDAHLSGWVLQVTGGTFHGWETIASGNSPVDNGLLTNWNTAGLPACSYTLRLLANDAATVSCLGSNGAEYLTSVELGGGSTACPGDINGDGIVDDSDLGILLNVFGVTCP